MESTSPSSPFRLSNLFKGDAELQFDLNKQSLSDMVPGFGTSNSKCNSPIPEVLGNDENASPNTTSRVSPNSKGSQSPKVLSPKTSPQRFTKSKNTSPVPPGGFQLELEKQSAHFQLNYAEDRQNKLMEKNISLQAALSNADRRFDKVERELSLAKQEIVTLQFDKDNLSNEVRKLTRTISAPGESSSGVSVWGQMTAASRELTRVEDELAASVRDLNELREENESLSRQAEKHAIKEEAHNATVKELLMEKKKNEELSATIALMMQENSDLLHKQAAQESTLQKEIDSREAYCASLNQELLRKERDIQLLFSEKEFLEGKLEHNKQSGGSRDSDISSLTAGTMQSDDGSSKRKRNAEDDVEFGETLQILEEYKNKLFTSESKRRKLLNELQDLRGNVRVFVRCRPFLPSDFPAENMLEEVDDMKKCVNCNVEGTTVSVSDMNLRGGGQVFQFDKVFDTSVQQEQVFSEVSDLVQSSLDGYRVCIFSYGQTGSGKTHTMTGSHSGDNRGIISRSVEQIIDRIGFMKTSGWSIQASYSMLEVYNETLIDLLARNEKGATTSKLQISMQNERVVVKNLTEEPMESSSLDKGMIQLEEILQRASAMRATASTAMNAESSRSHALFMMNISAKHEDGTCVQGGLRLVDLAGSERLDRTGTQGDAARLRETVNINKSLSCLGDVFLGLSKKSAHIPYRNSKLTMLLQDCLGGNGKTLMFVNISPTVESGQETVCSLKFANQVNKVQLGAAKKSVAIVQPAPPPPPIIYQNTMQTTSYVADGSSHSPMKATRSQTAPSQSQHLSRSNSNQVPSITHSPIKRRVPHAQHASTAHRGSHSHSHHASSPPAINKPQSSRRLVTASHTLSASSSLNKTKSKKGHGGWR